MQEGLSTELGGVGTKSVPLLPLLFNSHTITLSLLKCTVVFSIFSRLCTHHHYFQNILIFPKKPCTH